MRKIIRSLACLYVVVLFLTPFSIFAVSTNATSAKERGISNNGSTVLELSLLRVNTSKVNLLNKNDFTLNFEILEPKETRDLSISYRFTDANFGIIKKTNGATINSSESINFGKHQIVINTNGSGSSALVIELVDLLTGYEQVEVVQVLSRQTNFFLKGAESLYLKTGDNFIDPGFMAEDAVLGDVSNQVVQDNGVFNKDVPGTYVITYKLDVNNETLFLNRTLMVSNGNTPVESMDLIYTVHPNSIDVQVSFFPLDSNNEDVVVELVDEFGESTDVSFLYEASPFTSQLTQRISYIYLTGLASGLYEIRVTAASGVSQRISAYVFDAVSTVVFGNTKPQIKIGEVLEYTITTNPPNLEDQLFYSVIGDTGSIRLNAFTKKITGLAPGKVTVIADSGYGVSDSFELEVLDEICPDAVQSIVLSPEVVNIKTKREAVLRAVVEPQGAIDKRLSWKTSDFNVARVDDTGKIIGVGVGRATITATSVSFPSVTAEATVNVTLLEPTAVTVTPKSTTLNTGEFTLLKSTISPVDTDFQSITYASSNPNIAKVNSAGRVDALAAGTAIITVSSAYKPSINTTVQITVVNPIVKPTSLEITPISSSAKLLPYGSKLQLNATLLPQNATNKKILWRSRDERTAKVNANGLVTPVRQSLVDILAISEEDNSIKDEIRIRVYAYPAVLEDSDGDYYSKPNETITINVSGQSLLGQGGRVIVETSVNRFKSIKNSKTFPYTGGGAITGNLTYKLPSNGFSTFRARIVPNGTIHSDIVEIRITGGDKTYVKALSTNGVRAFP